MAINFDKYLYSTGTHYISNSGHDERRKYTGGAAGDQSGDEWSLRSWYNRPWSVVLRYPNKDVALTIAKLGIKAALNNKIGYDQYQRLTYWKQLKAANFDPSAITVGCEEDCTAGVSANVKAAGYLMNVQTLKELDEDTYSVNMKKRFVAAGFKALTDDKYLKGYDWLLPGDILLYESHHAATNITQGRFADFPGDNGTLSVSEQEQTYLLGERVLKNGMSGSDVKTLQTHLITLGYSCGSWGADGEFGDATELAVRNFQTEHGCDLDGEVGPQTYSALKTVLEHVVTTPKYVKITGGNCWMRLTPGITGTKYGVAYEGLSYEYVSTDPETGWYQIRKGVSAVWVSNKYGRLVE